MESDSVATRKYVMTFSLVYAALVIIIDILLNILDFNLGAASYFVLLIAAALYAVIKFSDDHKRAPNKHEKNRLIRHCLLASILISILDMCIVILITTGSLGFTEISTALGSIPAAWWLAIIAFALALYYLLLLMVFGWAAARYASKYQQ